VQGPSGLDKASLLASISGKGQGVTGFITFEGRSKFDIRAVSSYIPRVSE
jgi:ABC-type molybdate transport system ATPase subunit